MRGENSAIRQTYALLTFASSFYHGSETHLGERQDGMSNALFAFILHQAMLDSVPYSPVLHDLSHSPRNQSQSLQIRDQPSSQLTSSAPALHLCSALLGAGAVMVFTLNIIHITKRYIYQISAV